jgi:hypothetical protein
LAGKSFQISPLLQELIVYSGQLLCYEKCPELIEKMVGLKIGHSQINRVTNFYGAQLEHSVSSATTLTPIKPEDMLYVEVDGSMIFTRDDDWKEVKVGRIFKSSDCIDPNGKQSWIRHSQYLAYLQTSKEFIETAENIIDLYGIKQRRLIFINDGAVWIRNWIEDAYPNAISILDYFHALEHLGTFASSIFSDKKAKEKWVESQKSLLLDSKVKQVIKNIKRKSNSAESLRLINYYEANIARMDYKKFLNMGCGIIGSGAIESAHRTVVQKRMKQSGQRWSTIGAQNMLNLRVTYMNEKWENVVDLVKTNCLKTVFSKVA